MNRIKRMSISVVLAVTLAVATIPMSGCNTSQAQKANAVISAIIQIAQAEVALLPIQDQPGWSGFWSAAQVGQNALSVCVASAAKATLSVGGKVSACFSAFGQAFSDPKSLALIRVINPKSQGKAQLYITSIAAGINIIVAFTAPQVAPSPTAEEMHAFGETLVSMDVIREEDLLAFGY